jgi:hypothetical protein
MACPVMSVHLSVTCLSTQTACQLFALTLKAVTEISAFADLQIYLFTMKPSLQNTVSGLFLVSHKWIPLFLKVDMEDFHLFEFSYSCFQFNLTNVKDL